MVNAGAQAYFYHDRESGARITHAVMALLGGTWVLTVIGGTLRGTSRLRDMHWMMLFMAVLFFLNAVTELLLVFRWDGGGASVCQMTGWKWQFLLIASVCWLVCLSLEMNPRTARSRAWRAGSAARA